MSSNRIPLVFIHIGDAPPGYVSTAIEQARKWNPTCPIVFISSVHSDEDFADEEKIILSTVPKSPNHVKFLENTRLSSDWRGGFWRATTERLFVLEDWMRWKGIQECLHLENDIMLYTDVSALVPTLRKTSAGLSTTFQGQGVKLDQVRMCFSLLYCRSVDALSNFVASLAVNNRGTDEMQMSGPYWQDTPEECSVLPTAPTGVTLVSETFRRWYENPAFSCIFDAAAHGQYLGGIDPIHGEAGVAFVNRDTDYRTDQFLYGWSMDSNKRRYPVLMDKVGKIWHIANLHVHCKRLDDFT